MQADGDLRQMLYKTAAFVSEDMGASGESPLALLAECVEGERLLAVVHEGAAAVSTSLHSCNFSRLFACGPVFGPL